MVNDSWMSALAEQLPAQAKILDGLARAVESSDRWRSLIVGCSLGSGRGDQYSDIDAGLAYATSLPVDRLESAGLDLVEQVADIVDVLVHRYPDWPKPADGSPSSTSMASSSTSPSSPRRGIALERRTFRSSTRMPTSPTSFSRQPI